MALSRRTGQRFQASIWPGFVDAMTALLLVLMFVLTIFMIVQFMLRETITGQETELDELAADVVFLSQALGLERDRTVELQSDIGLLESTLGTAEARIATLSSQLQEQTSALETAQGQITAFEAQVAGLLADRDTDRAQIASLDTERASLLSAQEALNLALAEARGEIDAAAEAARLAAARREALQALIADLEAETETQSEQLTQNAQALSEAEATRLADAAAAQALRDRLKGAEDELTAMTLTLEAKRREAEETLTLLAAAETARNGLDVELGALLLARQRLEAQNADLQSALDDTQSSQQTANIARETFETQIADLLTENETLKAQIDALSADNATAGAQAATLQDQLAAALAEAAAANEAALAAEAAIANTGDAATQEAARQAALLAQANAALQQEEALSAESQRQVALLNAQIVELREQVGSLQAVLQLAEEADAEANIQIEALGSQLNTALARVAAEERRARALEEAENARLAEEAARLAAEAESAKEEVQDLEQFRSDFFGEMRRILEGQDRVQIVGDRFVFSSEVLFQPGQAELSAQGRTEIANIANILSDVADQIPPGIEWIIRVDGHTDNVPLGGSGRFRNNWELSQGRALSVVRYMTENLGIPPNRLAANGFGEYQPLNTADTPEARAQNRRIELKLTER